MEPPPEITASLRGKSFKRDNETPLTYRLKWAAWEWLYQHAQCRCIGLEARLEGPGGRVVDLVGVGPQNIIYVIEVKASPGDFSRDNHTQEDLADLKSRASLIERRRALTGRTLAQAREYARRANPDSWQEVLAYRKALADSQRADRERDAYVKRLGAYSIKFHDPAFLAIADYHYIMAPRGMIRRSKAPPSWGLLDPQPSVVIPAPQKEIRKNTGIVSNVLRAIGRINTTSMMRVHGVQFTEEGSVFPPME